MRLLPLNIQFLNQGFWWIRENKKLQNFLEKNSQDKGGDSQEIMKENQKLRILLEEKEQTEEFWKAKYQSLEKKLKILL